MLVAGCVAKLRVGRDLRARRVAGLRQWRVLRVLYATHTHTHINVSKLPHGAFGERALPVLRASR